MNVDEIRDKETQELPAYAWPGGYQIIYITEDNGVLCPDCANRKNGSIATTDDKDEDGDDTSKQWHIVAYDAYYEGPPIQCDHCNAMIESSYGDPDNED